MKTLTHSLTLSTSNLKHTDPLLSHMIKFSNLYLNISFKSLFDIFLYLRTLRKLDTMLNIYKLYLTFTSNRLFINLLNAPGKNYVSLSVGLFLKFFKNKKSFKKNKLVKLLLMKYVRKLLIISGIKNLYLYVQKKPLFFQELCKTLTTPLVNSFYNPISSTFVNEINNGQISPFHIRYLFFRQTKSFSLMRQSRQGRLKRKIMRRIIRTNRIAD